MSATSRYAWAGSAPTRTPLSIAPGVLLGIGLGGFLDGVLLHQLLQWHSMLSSVVPPTTVEAMHLNMFWDGVFHAAMWITTLAGVMLLWRSSARGTTPPLRRFVGALLIGWGSFNIVEGLIDHHLLQLHNVREVLNPAIWNIAFLAFSLVVMCIGVRYVSNVASRKSAFADQHDTCRIRSSPFQILLTTTAG